jgi:Flp pilus assembly protein TadD
MKPDFALAQSGRGLVLRDTGRLDEAVAPFTEATRLDPPAAATYIDLALAYRYAGRNDQAIADCSTPSA